jgi:hypothetical protein
MCNRMVQCNIMPHRNFLQVPISTIQPKMSPSLRHAVRSFPLLVMQYHASLGETTARNVLVSVAVRSSCEEDKIVLRN